jgi:hypothetical protein
MKIENKNPYFIRDLGGLKMGRLTINEFSPSFWQQIVSKAKEGIQQFYTIKNNDNTVAKRYSYQLEQKGNDIILKITEV